MLRLMLLGAALLLSAGPVLANGHGSSSPPPPKPEAGGWPARVVMRGKGPMLVDLKGMTLYYFERDNSGTKSTCDGKCAEKWIPLAAPADARATADFTVITRSDGSKMWAYRYRPLYTSHADKTPGEANGFDSSMLWHVARP